MKFPKLFKRDESPEIDPSLSHPVVGDMKGFKKYIEAQLKGKKITGEIDLKVICNRTGDPTKKQTMTYLGFHGGWVKAIVQPDGPLSACEVLFDPIEYDADEVARLLDVELPSNFDERNFHNPNECKSCRKNWNRDSVLEAFVKYFGYTADLPCTLEDLELVLGYIYVLNEDREPSPLCIKTARIVLVEKGIISLTEQGGYKLAQRGTKILLRSIETDLGSPRLSESMPPLIKKALEALKELRACRKYNSEIDRAIAGVEERLSAAKKEVEQAERILKAKVAAQTLIQTELDLALAKPKRPIPDITNEDFWFLTLHLEDEQKKKLLG